MSPKQSGPKFIEVFNTGVMGVNLVKSPLELDPGELTSAQNAEVFREQGLAGIRKRPGLQRANPTGAVVPSTLGGPVLGLYVIEAALPGTETYFLGNLYSTDRLTWSAWNGLPNLAPNTIYNLVSGSGWDANLTPLLPAVYIDGTYYFGGLESGQILAWRRTIDPSRGFAFDGDIRMWEAMRLKATGSQNDCYPLPGVFTQVDGQQALVVSLLGGGVQLYYPATNTVKLLPTLAATATGSASFYGRLWVVAGLSLYTIDPATETSWTTAATVADAGIAALTGLAVHNGNLYSGSRTNAVQPVRCYKFAVNSDSWTATATTSASVGQTASPSYMYGPFPQVPGLRAHVLYFGSAGIFDTLVGSLGNAEVMNGTSWRILTLDTGTAGPWHNGSDTATDNIINTWWNGSSNRNPGPIVAIQGKENWHYTHFQSTGDRFATTSTDPVRQRPNWSSSPGLGSDFTSIAATAFKYPLMI